MNELITEGIIPMNMNFHAMNNNNIQHAKRPAINKIELYTSVSAEIDRIISNLTVKYANAKNITDTDKIILIGSIENKFRETIARYKNWLEVDFLQFFENTTSLSKFSNIITPKEVSQILSAFVENKKIDAMITD